MVSYNNYDKLVTRKLIEILKTLQELSCAESTAHDNIAGLNSSSAKKDQEDRIISNCNESWIATLPIIIAEKNIDIPIESIFKLKNPALDIKSMKKDVYLTNSSLLPLYEKQGIPDALNGKLFLEGYIRNKLDFSIAKEVHDNIINLDTESVIIYVPFKFTTLIQYKSAPVFSRTEDYIPIYILSNCQDFHNDYHKNSNEYTNKRETQHEEYINCNTPPIKCEINKIKIHETYTLLDKAPFNKDFPIEMEFHTIKQNIIINLSLELLQKQDVSMSSLLMQQKK
ncbi:hypothetical protein K9O30_00255 [Clostridium bowmanii]|uniref:DUF7852 domain-containing protein n=1 Tax=Clostridium bowmanii TaxID=132925 RepID=UPI001C0ADCAA|nr:hypothetical protein [Clostridium bowmanii]MBU3188024.1 hypothetical protein [Clostridium bowmanii]MCA1072203.1 hypothetical protein [Clostridium bowmanii]